MSKSYHITQQLRVTYHISAHVTKLQSMSPVHNMHTSQYKTLHVTSQQNSLHNTTSQTKHGTPQQRTSYHKPHPTAVEHSTAQHSNTPQNTNHKYTPNSLSLSHPTVHQTPENAIAQKSKSHHSKKHHTTLQFDSILHKQQYTKQISTTLDFANLRAQFVKVNYRTSDKITSK